MTDTIERFIKLVNRMEENYKNDTRATGWIMPRELMLARRDELRRDQDLRDGIDRFNEIERNRRG